MSSHRINAAEKDLEKFIKFLALKSAQVVVQSRLGEKIQTSCNPLATGNDWFNISIPDHPDVAAETKRALALGQNESILQRLPFCIEISLRTVDGDQMVLEVWSLDLQVPEDKEDQVDFAKTENGKILSGGSNGSSNSNSSDQQTLKAAHALYNRMGILLKSLISLTRATPAYKLSRRQCSDSYGIYYRIYVDRPQTHTLGEGHKNVRIGQLNTIVGALSMSVAYRTKMTITPTTTQMRAGENNAIIVKSDHFRPNDLSPTQHQQTIAFKKGGNIGSGERKVIDIEKPLRPGAFTDVGKLRQYTEEDFILPETPPFEWLIKRTRNESSGSGGDGSLESLNRKSDSPVSSLFSNGHLNGNINGCKSANNNNVNTFNNNNNNATQNNNNNNNNNVTAFKNFECDSGNTKKSPANSTLSQSPIKSLLIPAPPATRHGSAPTLPSSLPSDDDNLLKELNFPFASPTSHVNDLAKFYRDCYHAPPLLGLSDLPREGNTCSAMAQASAGSIDSSAVDDVSRLLEQFETSLEDYDKLVAQYNLSGSSSTGSRSSGGLQMSN